MLYSPCQMIRGNGVSSSSSSSRGRCELGSAMVDASKDPKVSSLLDRTMIVVGSDEAIRWMGL